MKIYTKTGDTGETSLFGGKRLSKSDPQIEAYGEVDELTSFLGLVTVKIHETSEKEFFTRIQHDLYQIMGVLAGADTSLANLSSAINTFEEKIDELETKLPKLTRFIIPGGTEASALLHVVRTVCRRAERATVHLFAVRRTLSSRSKAAPIEPTTIQLIIQYLNRLSDLLFMYARWYNREHEILT